MHGAILEALLPEGQNLQGIFVDNNLPNWQYWVIGCV